MSGIPYQVIFCCWENVDHGAGKSELKSELEYSMEMGIIEVFLLLS